MRFGDSRPRWNDSKRRPRNSRQSLPGPGLRIGRPAETTRGEPVSGIPGPVRAISNSTVHLVAKMGRGRVRATSAPRVRVAIVEALRREALKVISSSGPKDLRRVRDSVLRREALMAECSIVPKDLRVVRDSIREPTAEVRRRADGAAVHRRGHGMGEGGARSGRSMAGAASNADLVRRIDRMIQELEQIRAESRRPRPRRGAGDARIPSPRPKGNPAAPSPPRPKGGAARVRGNSTFVASVTSRHLRQPLTWGTGRAKVNESTPERYGAHHVRADFG